MEHHRAHPPQQVGVPPEDLPSTRGVKLIESSVTGRDATSRQCERLVLLLHKLTTLVSSLAAEAEPPFKWYLPLTNFPYPRQINTLSCLTVHACVLPAPCSLPSQPVKMTFLSNSLFNLFWVDKKSCTNSGATSEHSSPLAVSKDTLLQAHVNVIPYNISQLL